MSSMRDTSSELVIVTQQLFYFSPKILSESIQQSSVSSPLNPITQIEAPSVVVFATPSLVPPPRFLVFPSLLQLTGERTIESGTATALSVSQPALHLRAPSCQTTDAHR